MASTPGRLRVEHLDDSLGITVTTPRMSWRLPPGATRQLAYRIRAGQWDSGRVESDRQLLVPYAGPALRSGERVQWSVKVWTDAGESEWAPTASWEAGLLTPADWHALWIGPPEHAEMRGRSPRPAWLLRRAFDVTGEIGSARLYATAQGLYECYLNGRRVGDLEMTPGFTSYHSRLQVQTYDVTDLLMSGGNVLGAVLSDGWYRGQTTGVRLINRFGDRTAFLAQLLVHHEDGTVTRIATDSHWQARVGEIIAADRFEGQVNDFQRAVANWASAASTGGGWAGVDVHAFDFARLASSAAPPVRRIEEIRPATVTRLDDARHVVDLGQNINGWVQFKALGPAGTSITLTHGELLDPDGDVTVGNVSTGEVDPAMHDLPWDLSHAIAPFQVDRVISAGVDGQVFEPRHTVHGFRYVRVEGYPGSLSPDDLVGVVVHTDLRRTGWFSCSDERVNRLYEAAVWSLRGNACDIPTDCPTRERMGWTGDWQLFTATAAQLFDIAGFTDKWLRDLAAEQLPNGVVRHAAPEAMPIEIHTALNMPPGSAGWGDAAVVVPWEIYRAYGDRDLLERHWRSMAAWVDYAARMAREHRHPDRAAVYPTPLPYEQYLWDTGFHWGEWLEPGTLVEFEADDFSELAALTTNRATSDQSDFATAYLAHSAQLLAHIARVLGKPEDERRYSELAASARSAWCSAWIAADGKLARDTQSNYVRALAFNLVPDELRPAMADRLVELIRKADTHLQTGFLSTAYLLPALADTGYPEVAYELLMQDTAPSWLSMIERGSTTIWEYWTAIDEDGRFAAPAPVGSLNHYGKGTVATFLNQYVAGIRPDPAHAAYQRFRIAPMPGGGLSWARGAYDCPFGRIESSWRINGDVFHLDVTVPGGTTAHVTLPDGRRFEVAPGTGSYRCIV